MTQTRAKWLYIHVTPAHIAAGVPSDCYDCPVGRALQEATGEPWNVMPEDALRDDYHGPYRLWHFSKTVQHWIADYDDGKVVGVLTLRLPRRFLRGTP
jgi:hypothetical protein